MDFWKAIKANQYKLIIITAIALYTISFSWFTIAKHNTFNTYAWDLGIFDQGFWTTINLDRIFYYTCELHLSDSGSFFGIHFSPILLVIVPLYYLKQRAETLLIIQSLVIGLSAVPVYKIAQIFHGKNTSCVLACLYLLNPTLHGLNSYDFHVQGFLPLTLGYVLYYTLSHRWFHLILALNITLAVQEQVFYLMAAYTVFLIVFLLKDQESNNRQKTLIILLS